MDLNWCGGLIVALLIGLASPEASGSKSTWVDLGENVESLASPEASGSKYIRHGLLRIKDSV